MKKVDNKEALGILILIFLACMFARCGWEAGGELSLESGCNERK